MPVGKRDLKIVTGLWTRKTLIHKPTKNFDYLKSGRMDERGLNNLNYFDTSKMIFMVLKRRRGSKNPNPPDYYLVTAEDWGMPQKDIYWDDLPENKR